MVFRKRSFFFKNINSALIDLPVPVNLNMWWNFGSLLGLCLIIQIVTGVFLAMHYCPTSAGAFTSIRHIMVDVNKGWLLRGVHMNVVSFFMLFCYVHILRGYYYNSFVSHKWVWVVGMGLNVLLMGTAFLGYVLPWGQISFWGATVITNLLSAVPYIGSSLTVWVWGGFSVGNATLQRFFVLHFILPFLMVGLSVVHLLLLHEEGSSDPLGLDANIDKVVFHPYYTVKDFIGVLVFVFVLLGVVFIHPTLFLEVDNLSPANPLSTPTHIKPEWYFLQYYAILRAVPNKLGGVVLIVWAILSPVLLPWWILINQNSSSFQRASAAVFWVFVVSKIMLTWLGGCPVEFPYDSLTVLFTWIYFIPFSLGPCLVGWWDYFINYNWV